MRAFYSYTRLFLTCVLIMGGLSIQFLPSAAGIARDARWRERQLLAIPAEQHAKWIEDRDAEDSTSYAYLRLSGVLLGGLGLAVALRENAYLSARYGRR